MNVIDRTPRVLLVAVGMLVVVVGPAPGKAAGASGPGVRVGVAGSQLYEVGEVDATVQPLVGVSYRAEGAVIGLMLEACYLRQGAGNVRQAAGYDRDEEYLVVRQDVRRDYLRFPLLATLRVEDTPLRFLAGPSFGFLVNHAAADVDDTRSRIVRGLEWTDFRETALVNLEQVAGFDLGLVAGMCVETVLRGRGLALDVRYQLGLSDVDPTAGEARNRSLMGSVRIAL